MHSEQVMERLVEIAKGEAPELPEPGEEVETEAAESSDEAADTEAKEE